MNLLIFTLGSERYATRVADVRHILQAVAITRLPGAPPLVKGVVNVHGVLTPVYDLRRRFGLESRPPIPQDHFILTESKGRTALLHVDGVDELVWADPALIDDPEDLVVGALPIAGVAKLEDGLVLIHDLEAFLTQAESETLDAALAAAGESWQEEAGPGADR